MINTSVIGDEQCVLSNIEIDIFLKMYTERNRSKRSRSRSTKETFDEPPAFIRYLDLPLCLEQ